jgi:hypothetical protein
LDCIAVLGERAGMMDMSADLALAQNCKVGSADVAICAAFFDYGRDIVRPFWLLFPVLSQPHDSLRAKRMTLPTALADDASAVVIWLMEKPQRPAATAIRA